MESSVPPGRIFGWSYLRDHRQVWCFLDLTLRPDVEEFPASVSRVGEISAVVNIPGEAGPAPNVAYSKKGIASGPVRRGT
jgi:hypothetical protein